MTETPTVGGALSVWAARAARHVSGGTDWPSRADHLMAETDRAEQIAIREMQAANKHAAYERRRPIRYRSAGYERLHEHQNPRGKVARWLEHGPRALVLVGPARTGKTTAAYAVANAAHAAHQWVIVWPAADLSAALKPDGDPIAFDHAVACDLLVLDDLGRERATDWWLEQLQRLVDARCAHDRRLVVTANTPPDSAKAYDELIGRYGDPIVERLIDDGGVVVVDGPAQRRLVDEW